MKMLTLSIILMAFPFLSHARGYYDRGHDNQYDFWQTIEEQQCRQRDLIDSGMESGQLTSREISKLRGEQQHADQQVRHYRQFGHLSYAYQRELRNYLDHVGERISYLKHNSEYNRRHHYNNNHNPFTHSKHSRWNGRNNRHSIRVNRNDGSAGFYFRF